MGDAKLDWDPFDRSLHRAPHAVWKRLRDDAPVYHNEEYDFYALSRFHDVLEASLDTERYSSAHGVTLDMIGPDELAAPKPMIMMDPPDHTGMRKLVTRTFTPRRINALEERIRTLCATYLDPFVGSGGFDYVVDFSMKLPVMVISSLLGFPEVDHDRLREWSDAQLHREPGSPDLTPEGQEAFFELMAYYQSQVEARRADPSEDIVSDIMASELVAPDGTGRQLDDGEVLMFIALISIAGNETVARLLGSASIVLADFPDQRAKLLEHPELMPSAVEELLRFEAPSPVQGRYTLADIELHDTVIPAGSKVALLTGSAGRDEREYRDPDVFDIERTSARNLTFGYGAHFCLGAALARMEAKVALEETLRRFPTWDVDASKVEYVHTNSVRGPASVPISW